MAIVKTRLENRWRNGAAALAFCLLAPMPTTAFSAETQKPATIDADIVLSELNHLSDELEKQRKFSRILLEKIDAMQKRIDELESQSSDPSAKKSPSVADEQKPPSSETSKAPNEGTPDKEIQPEQDGKKLPDEFEQFLDMGEAMLRRFFGVVKEFRKEFEDNRA